MSPALARRAPAKPVQQQEQSLEEKLSDIEESSVIRSAAATHRAVEKWSNEQDRRRNG